MKTVVSAANATTNAVATTAAAIATATTTPAVLITPKATDTASSTLPFVAPLSASSTSTTAGGGTINRRPISLDLKGPQSKKQRSLALESPDNKPLNTPDLEKVILSCLPTPQPGMLFPAKVSTVTVTSEQEEFGKGFEDALNSLHNSKQLNHSVGSNSSTSSNASVAAVGGNTVTTTATTGMSGGSFTYTNLETFPVVVKDEPQNPASPPVSPIDMETQEKIKLERKRQRNRVAASKCRKRKLERISKLEERVKMLKGENTDLAQVVKSLKDHVAQLKQQVIEHIETGCSIPTNCSGATLLQGK